MSHAAEYGRASEKPENAHQIIFDYRKADLNNADLALCHFAVKLTRKPGEMTQADVDALQVAGFSDEQITLAAQVIGYFNYINRIADGLGVDLEESMTLDIETWRKEKANWT